MDGEVDLSSFFFLKTIDDISPSIPSYFELKSREAEKLRKAGIS